MIFTSYTYLLFLLVIFAVHWSVPAGWRKPVLIGASYVFYGTWDWRFGCLLLGLSVFNWLYARWVLTPEPRTWTLSFGVSVNLGALLYFKYTSFILANAAEAVRLFGAAWHPTVGDIVLPLGISFFTFQGIAYLVDVAAGEEPLYSLRDFLLFKALWPQLIAGPIIRLSEIRDQLSDAPKVITYDDLSQGSKRILFGFFKKVVFADNLAPYVDTVFSSAATPHMLDAVVGTLGFGLQIYFDFSAYSDIAIGSARLFGFRFPENFNWPYAAASPQQFWGRWHMTLSRWIRDYLYTPLVFANRRRPRYAPIWLLIAMALCGLWHGARWTFVAWGAWHGTLLLMNQTVLRGFFPTADGRTAVSWPRRLSATAVTLTLVYIGWIIFRSASVAQALVLLESVATFRGGLRPAIVRENVVLFVGVLFLGVLVAQIARDFLARRPGLLPRVEAIRGWLRPMAYTAMILAIVAFDKSSKAFIYFQF